MAETPLITTEQFEEFSRLTLLVENMLDFHPEFDPRRSGTFTSEDCVAFFWLTSPKWKAEGNYRDALRTRIRSPRRFVHALKIVGKWADLHGINLDLPNLIHLSSE